MSIKDIIALAAAHYGLDPLYMMSRRRLRTLCEARHAGMKLARLLVTPQPSYLEIAEAFNRTDHKTAMHAMSRPLPAGLFAKAKQFAENPK